MTKVLLIGNGAREHALAKALVKNSATLFAYMKANNPGITELSKETVIGNYDDLTSIVDYAKLQNVEFVVIGPEDPLGHGVADALSEANIPCVGPKKNHAQLECSKSFTRDMMVKYSVDGCPKFKTFTDTNGLKEFLEELPEVVIKPDGLTGGKGVQVQGDHFTTKEEAFSYCEEVLSKHPSVVVEEKLVGEEFSLMSFTDGVSLVDCPPVQDHKRAYVDDTGPNTGGMGSYSDADHSLPFLSKEHIQAAHNITEQMMKALKQEFGEGYKGIMYGGFIITKTGVKVIEYNARLGDPEAMNVLSIFKSDFVELCKAIINETVSEYTIEFEPLATVCKYAVPEGYPEKPVKNEKVGVGDASDVEIYYASVDKKEDGLYMTGSRAIAVVGKGGSISEAEKKAEKAISSVTGKVFHREDIGTEQLIQKRIDHMKELLG